MRRRDVAAGRNEGDARGLDGRLPCVADTTAAWRARRGAAGSAPLPGGEAHWMYGPVKVMVGPFVIFTMPDSGATFG